MLLVCVKSALVHSESSYVELSSGRLSMEFQSRVSRFGKLKLGALYVTWPLKIGAVADVALTSWPLKHKDDTDDGTPTTSIVVVAFRSPVT